MRPPSRCGARARSRDADSISFYQGTPFVYGEPNSLPGGVTVTPLNVRFYLSAIELLTASGGSVPVDVVTTSGTVQPYGLFLFNAEDAGAQTLRVLAPPGASIRGVKLAVGMGPACNAGPTAGNELPALRCVADDLASRGWASLPPVRGQDRRG